MPFHIELVSHVVLGSLVVLYFLGGWCYGFYLFWWQRDWLNEPSTGPAMTDGVFREILRRSPGPLLAFLVPFVCLLLLLVLLFNLALSRRRV